MGKLFNVSSSPHVRSSHTTQAIMFDVAIAMLPASIYGVWQFGMHALLVLIATVVSCVLSEYIFEKLMKKPITVYDGSAVVTGMILALNMPPQIPVWMPCLGGVFAIIIVKQMYGGLGQNWMNPALAARCFLLISFAGKMTTFTEPFSDAVASATPMAMLKAGEQVDVTAMFIGRIPGTIGEVSVIALLIGAVYLDGGFANAKEFITRFVLNDLENKKLFYDSKTILQEIVQRDFNEPLSYELLAEEGPDHDKKFRMQAKIGEKAYGVGVGHTKKGAQQLAAYETILLLKKTNA